MEIPSITKGEEEKSNSYNLNKFGQKLKVVIYSIFTAALRSHEVYYYQALILLVISFFQILAFAVDEDLKDMWGFKEEYAYVQYFLSFFNIYFYYSFLSSSGYFIIFYGAIFYVLCIYAMALYVYLALRSSSASSWLLTTFSTCLLLNLTILHIPITGTLLSMLSCENGLQYYQPTIVCWYLDHYLHSILGILFCFFFFVSQVLSATLFFEPSWLTRSVLARKVSSVPLLELTVRTILTITQIFVKSDSSKLWINSLLFVIAYLYIGGECLTKRVFISTRTQFMYILYYSGIIWCGFSMILTAFLEKSYHSANPVIFVLGLILNSLFIAYSPLDINLSRLSRQFDDFASPEDAILSIEELLKLIDKKDEKEHSFMLYGFLVQHTNKCQKVECSLTELQNSIHNETRIFKRSKAKGKAKRAPKIDWNISFFNFLNVQFARWVSRFSEDIPLRLFFSLFLVERFRHNSLALNELLIAEAKHPNFFQQFLIFRYRHLIKDNIILISKKQNQSYSVAAVMTYEATFKEFKKKIEKASVSYIYFWSLLWDESPNMQRLVQTGFKILSLNDTIDNIWRNLQQMSINTAKVLRLYASYCSQITNNAEKSKDVISRAHESLFNKSHVSKQKLSSYDSGNLSKEESPCVIISGRTHNLGAITECNLSFCRLFGYEKKEIVGQRIETLMPEMYAKYHQEILLRNLEYKAETEKEIKKEMQIFGLQKSGYIFPATLRIVGSPSSLNTSGYVGIFSIKKQFATSSIAFLLIDGKLDVKYTTSSAIAMLKLDKSLLNTDTVHAKELLPTLFGSSMEQFMSSGDMIAFHVYKEKITSLTTCGMQSPNEVGETLNPNSEASSVMELHCHLQEIKISRTGTIGYSVKLEQPTISDNELVSKNVKYPMFQFRYDHYINKFVREISGGGNEETSKANQGISMKRIIKKQLKYSNSVNIEDKSVISPSSRKIRMLEPDEAKYELKSKLSEMSETNKGSFYATIIPKIKNLSKFFESDPNNKQGPGFVQEIASLLASKQINYARNVETYRLINGELIQINDDNATLTLMTQDQIMSICVDDDETRRRDASTISVVSQIKTKETLEVKLIEGTSYTELTILLYISIFLFLGLVAFSILLYVFSSIYFDSAKNGLNNMYKIYNQYIYIQTAIYNTRHLVLLNFNLTFQYIVRGLTKQQYYNSLSNEMFKFSDSITDADSYLTRYMVGSINENEYNIYYHTSSVKMVTLGKNETLSRYYTYPEAILEFCAGLYAGSKVPSDDYIDTNYYFYLILQNGLNSITDTVDKVGDLFYNTVILEESKNMSVILTIFVVAICISVLFVPVALTLISLIHSEKEKIMLLFLELPATTIKSLNSRCESFLETLRYGNDTDIDSVFNEDKIVDKVIDYAGLDQISRRKRKFSNKPNFMKNVTLVIFIVVSVISVYFGINYYLEKDYRENHKTSVDTFNKLLSVEKIAKVAINYQRECIYNYTGMTVHGDSPCKPSQDILDKAYTVTSVLNNLTVTAKFASKKSIDTMNILLQGDLCINTFGIYINSSFINCDTVAEGVVHYVKFNVDL